MNYSYRSSGLVAIYSTVTTLFIFAENYGRREPNLNFSKICMAMSTDDRRNYELNATLEREQKKTQ
jgi:hypothetical protein